MTQSPEYPDLLWIVPKSWTNANRTSVQLIVIHDTEGSSNSESAEDGARYNQTRTDGTSAHYFHDSNSTVQGVRTEDESHCAREQGNNRGIHHELCAKASWSKAQWLSPDYGLPMLRIVAKQCARDAKKWNIPVRKLNVGQVADGVKGFCGHVEITYAFPQDNGTHTDPGPNFPWPQFLDMVRAELDGDTDMFLPTNGSTGEEVKFWQHMLTELEFSPGDIDGVYGPKTQAAVAAFRKSLGVTTNYTYLTSWTAFALFRSLAEKYAGKDGKNGAPGTPGKDGQDGQNGTLTGTLSVTGGKLTVEAV